MYYTISDDRKTVYIYKSFKTIKCRGLPFKLAIVFTSENGNAYRFAGFVTKGFIRKFWCSPLE